jgi:translation initiation factor 3 subunit C
LEEIKSLYDILDKNKNIVFGLAASDEESERAKDVRAGKGETIIIRGNPASYVDRLDDEFFKSLLTLDAHTSEYTERLRDETELYCILVRAQKYAELHTVTQELLDLILLRRIEHLYYKPSSVIESIEKSLAVAYPKLRTKPEEIENLIIHFCNSLYKTTIDRIRNRALLCHVYHLALRDDFHQAKTILLMSHLQDTIGQSDISTQTLYNRTLVQTGLCAFRAGLFRDAHDMLQEMCSSGKTKELLAQGISNQKERTPEQEKLDRSRQLPYHMHVNLDLLESVYLVSAMLLEIPNMARYRDSRRRIISKSFRRMLEYNDKQIFTG